MTQATSRWGKCGLAILMATLLQGCTTEVMMQYAAPKAGFETVSKSTAEIAGKDAVWLQSGEEADIARDRVAELVRGKTISADTAVQVALLNNKGLQAAYAELGLSAAEVWQQALLPNPKVSLGLLGIDAPEVGLFRTVEGTVTANIVALLTRKGRMDTAKTEFSAAQLRAVSATLSLAAETRRAWIEAVAAYEAVIWLSEAQRSADAASELAAELGKSGAFSKAAQAREHVFYAELTAQKAEALLAAKLAKEELARLMGLWGGDLKFFVPDYLPALPRYPKPTTGIEREALEKRFDLQIAKLDLEAMAHRLRLTGATRLVSDLELTGGLERETEIDNGQKTHVLTGTAELEFEIPIFDSGKARMRKAELTYLQAANLLAERAVNARSEARSAALALKASHEIAAHYQNAILPLRTTISKESLLTYNGMITNTFELLADTRARTGSVLQAADARRKYWLAEANTAAVIYGGSSLAATGTTTIAAGDSAPKH